MGAVGASQPAAHDSAANRSRPRWATSRSGGVDWCSKAARAINASMYEVAAFEALNNGLRSGDLYVLGSRRYQTFESYLLTKEHWTHVKQQARRAWPSAARRLPTSKGDASVWTNCSPSSRETLKA